MRYRLNRFREKNSSMIEAARPDASSAFGSGTPASTINVFRKKPAIVSTMPGRGKEKYGEIHSRRPGYPARCGGGIVACGNTDLRSVFDGRCFDENEAHRSSASNSSQSFSSLTDFALTKGSSSYREGPRGSDALKVRIHPPFSEIRRGRRASKASIAMAGVKVFLRPFYAWRRL